MLYGHIETREERVDHMLRARALQDETAGFQAFIPLAFHPDNNRMEKLPPPTAADTLRVHAVARLMLDNVPHIKAFWIATGVEVAQTALWFGVDDLDGTVQEERIYHMAGAPTPEAMTAGRDRPPDPERGPRADRARHLLQRRLAPRVSMARQRHSRMENRPTDGPHELPPLPYDFNALEPHIDEQTMRIHHGKHHATYVSKLNGALEKHPELAAKGVDALIGDLDSVPADVRTAVRNNGGGHSNHSLFWQVMSPTGGGQPTGAVAAAIDASFGSYDALKAGDLRRRGGALRERLGLGDQGRRTRCVS